MHRRSIRLISTLFISIQFSSVLSPLQKVIVTSGITLAFQICCRLGLFNFKNHYSSRMFYLTYFMREVPKNHLKSILSWSHEKVKLVAICNLQGLVGTILTTENSICQMEQQFEFLSSPRPCRQSTRFLLVRCTCYNP